MKRPLGASGASFTAAPLPDPTGAYTSAARERSGTLRLRTADTFFKRLLGLHAGRPPAPDEALLIQPCNAVHTFFLRYAIDVVFLDTSGAQLRCIHRLPPRCWAAQRGARSVIELPAGYCKRHPDYLVHIHAALRLRVSPRLPA